ncbi:MAG: hypothetical protein HQ463_06925 [Bacteroidetes bacterium]|nr:hypothetical protein [Bacteroidota bacterium]
MKTFLNFHIVVLIFVSGIHSALISQNITPLGISYYGAVRSYHLNPSLNAYSFYKWHINVAGTWVNINNNYINHRLPFSAYKLPNNFPSAYKSEYGNLKWDRRWLVERLNGNSKQLSVAADVYGPSASIKINSWRIGFITSAYANARGANLPENFAHAIFKEFDSIQGAFNLFTPFNKGGENTISEFALVGNARISAGFNISKAIKLDFDRQLLLGITIKRNWGLPGFYLYNSGMTLKTISPDSVVFMPTNIQMVTYGNEIGKGMGYDIGATYLFNKKHTKRHGDYHKNQTQYFAKIGFSIMDIGKITYKEAEFTQLNTTTPIGINSNTFYINNANYEASADSFLNTIGTVKKYTGAYQVGLPTRIVVSGDFQLKKNLFISGVITQSLRKKLSKNASYQSALMVAPRIEYRYFEVSLPAYLTYDYRAFRMGIAFRVGPLYFGSNSIYSFINTKNVRDADVFIGIAFGNNPNFNLKNIFKRKKSTTAKKRMGCFNSF